MVPGVWCRVKGVDDGALIYRGIAICASGGGGASQTASPMRVYHVSEDSYSFRMVQ